LPSGEPKRLTKRSDAFELYPSYSRDGSKLAYVTWNDERQGQIIIRDLRSGRETVLPTGTGKFVEPVFSPDGKTLVYRKFAGGYLTSTSYGLEPGLYQIASDGKSAPQFISNGGTQPQFGDRNDRIYVMSFAGMRALQSIDLTTKQRRTLYQSEHATEFRV
jgi:Tol biopolymer transport system component